MRNILFSFLFCISSFSCAQENVAITIIGININREEIVRSDVKELTFSYDNNLITINGLEKLHMLKTISFIGLTNLSNLSFLSSCRNIETIAIDACMNIVDISAIYDMTSLKNISIRECKQLGNNNNIQIDLKNLESLEYFQIADCDLEKILYVVNIPNKLRYFNISGNNFKSIDFLKDIPDRVFIYLFNNKYTLTSLNVNIILSIDDFLKNVPASYLYTY